MWPHQKEAIRRAVAQRRLLLLLAPGDGKTAVALTALTESGALPALVAAPALVAETDVWGEEARSWEHLRHLRVAPVAGSPARRLAVLRQRADVYVVSYENLMWLTDVRGDLYEAGFSSLVFDEVSKMKAPGTKRFRRMRARSMAVPFRLGLTGTPVGNHLLDLWGEGFVVGGPRVLGPRFGDYRDEHFQPYDYYRRVWGLKGMRRDTSGRPTVRTPESRRHETAIHRAVRPWSYARPTAERPGVPPVREVVRRVPVPPELDREMTELRGRLWTTLPSGAELEALQASAVATKLRQMAGGAVYLSRDLSRGDAELSEGKWEEVHGEKVRALLELVDELQGEPLLVFYWFRHERERLLAALGGRAAALESAGAVADWNAGRVEVGLAHPQSAGLGLNLQGGGHHAAWFTLPWARWQYDQGNGRLARPGQAAPEVVAHLLLCGPVDDDVAAVLRTKGETEQRLMNAVR